MATDEVPPVSFDNLPETPLLLILQKVARDTGRSTYATVCKRWRLMLPLAQVQLELVGRYRTAPITEVSWTKILSAFPNLESLSVQSHGLLSDFILGAIASCTTRLRTLQIRAYSEKIVPVCPEQGLHFLLHLKSDLRTLSLSASGEGFLPLPQCLTFLSHLKSLKCRGVRNQDVGAITCLVALRELQSEIWGLENVPVPDVITRLTCLTKLTLSGFTELPEGMGAMSKLLDLRLEHGQIRALPSSIMTLQSLQHVTLDSVDIEEFPQSLLTLPLLKHLDIR